MYMWVLFRNENEENAKRATNKIFSLPFLFYFFCCFFFKKIKMFRNFYHFLAREWAEEKKLYQHLKYAFCTTTTVTLLLLASSSSSSLPFFIAFSRGFYACFYRKTKILLLRSRNYLLAKKKWEKSELQFRHEKSC